MNSNYSNSSYLHELLSDGYAGYAYLLKSASIDQIKKTILTVARGGLYIDPDVARQAHTPPQLNMLTPRERDVLATMASGLENQGIARELRMSASTVGMHISNIYSKLEVDALPDKHAPVSAVLLYHGLADTGPSKVAIAGGMLFSSGSRKSVGAHGRAPLQTRV